jgi:hypothetical protein
MRIFKAGVLYFALVFAAGFVLGIVRTQWVVPRLGVRTAELLESPIMLAITVLAARFVVRRCALPPAVATRLGTGLIALGILLTAEFGVALWLRGLTLRESVTGRDPVSGSVYLGLLVLFALMPLLVARKQKPH